jgi:hypothetical protein
MRGYGSRRSVDGAESGPCGRVPCGLGRIIASLALCLGAAGCGSLGPTLGPSAQAGSAKDFSIAFESIDGLPRDVSPRLVHDLGEEAAALRIAVAPAGGDATYRLRGYLAAHAGRSVTSVSWAWDVYDGELHRAFRLSGEAQAGPATGRDAGGALADETVLRAIAHAGMQQLADFAAAAPAPAAPAAPTPGRTGSAVASREDTPSGPAAGAESAFRTETVAGLARLADTIAGR